MKSTVHSNERDGRNIPLGKTPAAKNAQAETQARSQRASTHAAQLNHGIDMNRAFKG